MQTAALLADDDTSLTVADYRKILQFYKIKNVGLTVAAQRAAAEHILATKLCKCIKRVGGKEQKAIAICYTSVVKRKHLKVGRFTCKKGARFTRRLKKKVLFGSTSKLAQ